MNELLNNRYIYVLAMLLIVGVFLPTGAQQSPNRQNSTIKLKNPRAAVGRNMVDYNGQPVEQPPHLASIPDYPGHARYISGIVYPHQNGSSTYNLCYGAKEDPQQVCDWYENALAMQKIWDLKSTSNSITAMSKDGNFCNITVQPGSVRGEKSTIIIVYGLAHP